MPIWLQTTVVLSACSASALYLCRKMFKKNRAKGCNTCSRCGGCGGK